jgi:outer membrane receptor protein involved in Fe transport
MKKVLAGMLALAAVASAAPLQSAAQAPGMRPPSGTLVGSVVDASTRKPLASATVSVWSARDSTLVTGALTRRDGGFTIEGMRPGDYFARVSYIGYTTSRGTPVAIPPGAERVDVGALALEPSAVEIEAITATAERSEVVLSPDRNVYNVANLPSTAGGTAVDALRNVPSVEVDIDGRVSLRGNQNVAIQVNGRATPMRGEQLGQFLQQMPASLIERIEVIPNPSARHDPDGMAGILNIVLKQNTDLGRSGGLIVGGGTTDRINASGNLGYQQGPVTLYGSYGFFRDTRAMRGSSFRENRWAQPSSFLEQTGTGEQSPLSHNFTGSAEYRLGKRDLVSANLLAGRRGFASDQANRYFDLDASRTRVAGTLRSSEMEFADLTLDATLGFRRSYEPNRHELSAEVRVSRLANEVENEFSTLPLDAGGSPAAGRPALERNEVEAITNQWTLQSDYTRTLAGATRLETGYKGTGRQLDNDLAVSGFSTDAGRWILDPNRSNAFEYAEQVHAVYGVLSRGFGRLNLQGGLRAEQALTDFRLSNTGDSFENDYTSLFPSAVAAFDVREGQQVKASYSKRVQRPDTRLLNPFAFYEDPLNVQRGNPFLKPEYTHAFELGYQQMGRLGMLQVTPFFRHTVDAIRWTRTVDDDGVTTTSFRNYATSDSYGADLTATFRRGPVSGFAGGNAARTVTESSGSTGGLDAFSWSLRANASVRLSPKLDAQSFLMYRAPMDVEAGRISGMTMMHLALRQKLAGDRASVTLRVVDPFDLMRFSMRTSDDRHIQETERRFGIRGAYLTFNYSFGQQPRIRQRPGQEQPDAMPPGGPPL